MAVVVLHFDNAVQCAAARGGFAALPVEAITAPSEGIIEHPRRAVQGGRAVLARFLSLAPALLAAHMVL